VVQEAVSTSAHIVDAGTGGSAVLEHCQGTESADLPKR
jgi:hypothetical protein